MTDNTTPDTDTTDAQEVTDSPETFDREYVERLRSEAADYRRQLRESQQQLTTYRDELDTHAVRVGTEGVLARGDELSAFIDLDQLRSDDGRLDPDRVREAATTLSTERPHLQARRFQGSADAGPRSRREAPQEPALAQRLRNAAAPK